MMLLNNPEITKKEVLEKSIKWWNPSKTLEWRKLGIDLVIGKREGCCFYDMDGKKLMDVHLNGGTYSLGHRNPEIVATLEEGLKEFDIGNHHFPSVTKALLAEKLAALTPGDLCYSIYSSGGGEAVDVAIKSARYATGRKKVISLNHCYHGHTGLALGTGDDLYSAPFHSEGRPEDYGKVTLNDVGEMEQALAKGDAACVIIETIPATYGFPIPEPGYLKRVKELCEKYGTLYIADEVQTGLMRTGKMWGIEYEGVDPDILVTSKGFSGGIYPIAATVVNRKAGKWLEEAGRMHSSTFGGSDVGCIVAMKVLEICSRPQTRANVAEKAAYLRDGLEQIRSAVGEDFFSGIRQRGLVMGLEFNYPEGGKIVMRSLYENGVWAIYSRLNPQVVQFKPGILIDTAYCDELLEKLERGIRCAKDACSGKRG